MRLLLTPLLSLIISLLPPPGPGVAFLKTQKTYERVRAAYAAKAPVVDALLARQGLARGRVNILLAVYKDESELEIWAKAPAARTYQHLTTLPICARSGYLGPKRALGDEQTPEGFYEIDRFHPESNFLLSLGLDYPNTADRRREPAGTHFGGDIFLHGDCVTIGCVPLTDTGIQLLYVLAVEARAAGQVHLPVYCFPARLTADKLDELLIRYPDDSALAVFWQNIQRGYDAFASKHEELRVGVDTAGAYTFR